jgi:hypothetical protein
MVDRDLRRTYNGGLLWPFSIIIRSGSVVLIQSTPLPYGAILLLAGLVVAFGVAVLLFRRWMQRPDTAESSETAWTLQQLRALRDKGEITIPEYERLKAAMLGNKEMRSTPLPQAPGGSAAAGGDPGRGRHGDSSAN